MKRTAAHSVALVTALILAPPFLAAGAKARVSHTIVAATGGAAPDGGHYVAFTTVALNPRSQVAFDASLGGPSSTGVFVGDGKGTSTIALGGDPDPASANFGFVNNPFITPRGDVVFDVDFSDTLKYDGRVLAPLVRNGDPAPGGGTVSPIGRTPNARGAIAYLALVDGAAATQGIFRTDGAKTVSIARDDDVVPTNGTFINLSTPAINTRGQVAFFAEMSGGAADFAIFRGDGGRLTPVFVANEIAPGGATFQDFSDPLINTHGQVAAVALLTNGPSRAGLFIGDGTDTVAVALDGQAAPRGGNYTQSFASPLAFNDRGEVAFQAFLTGGTSSRGIFRSNGRQTTVLALAGTTAPGTTGRFESFTDLKLGPDGRVAFIGTLTPGVGDVDLTNNMGIWIGTSDADLELVVRTGEVIGGKVLTRLPNRFGQFDMNDDGVVWIGRFPSNATAVVFSRTRDANEDDPDRDRSGRQ